MAIIILILFHLKKSLIIILHNILTKHVLESYTIINFYQVTILNILNDPKDFFNPYHLLQY